MNKEKKHNCLNYRYTTEKYCIEKDEKGNDKLNMKKAYLQSWCARCGYLIGNVERIDRFEK